MRNANTKSDPKRRGNTFMVKDGHAFHAYSGSDGSWFIDDAGHVVASGDGYAALSAAWIKLSGTTIYDGAAGGPVGRAHQRGECAMMTEHDKHVMRVVVFELEVAAGKLATGGKPDMPDAPGCVGYSCEDIFWIDVYERLDRKFMTEMN